jgi:hypothetical protein
VPADASVLCDKAAVIGAAIKDVYDVHKLAGLDDDGVQRSYFGNFASF